MKRRDFLKILGVGGIALALPISTNIGYSAGYIQNIHVGIKIREEDFGHALGIAYSLIGKDGMEYRQGVYEPEWRFIKEHENLIMELSEKASLVLNDWMKGHKELDHYIPTNGKMIYDEIQKLNV